ncbi:transcriptional regulator NanR [Salipiger sp.]|uniref:transcriptional regulator NanR n=1 Tax=Salipiger sp. TaxID=2078585 RepID=UPI003A96D4E8
MIPPDPIRPRKLSEDVQDRLLALIRDDGLKPGDTLPSERELMAQYGVGRPAIREAMQSLQQAGIVEIRHGGRPRIAAPSLELLMGQTALAMQHLLTHSTATLAHLKEARATLEAELARLAAERRTEDDIVALRAILDRQAASRDNSGGFLEQDGLFHKRIAAISRNPLFETVGHGLFQWLSVFHKEFVRSPGLEALTLAEHEAILAAIAGGDGPTAAQAMRDHLERANTLYHQDHLSPPPAG